MTASSTRPVRLLVLGMLGIMAFLAACGSSNPTNGEASKSAVQIFSDAKSATESASSVHISGRITSGSDKVGLDFVDSSGRSGGTISDNGATFQIILSGKTVYLKGSEATMSKLSGSAAAGQLLGSKWLQTTTGNKDFGGLAGLFNLPNLIANIQPTGTLHKGPVTTIDGQSVVALTDSTRKGTLYVADSGRPYMIELVGGPGEAGMITFDQYSSARPPAIPSGAINLDQLEGGSGA
ncbi:MAG TPA: hypothetical protein VN796_05720 [Acidimicrobiales bacterium]|nr:hypothetical protein [Acidimicrobiales bacterium]